MAKLSVMDLAFFLTETDASPKHVGGLLMFRKPAKAAANYVEQVVAEYAGNINEIRAPFNQIIKFSRFSAPQWQVDNQFNIENHVFFHTLSGNDFRDSLYAEVSELHSIRLDKSRPMWEMHDFKASMTNALRSTPSSTTPTRTALPCPHGWSIA